MNFLLATQQYVNEMIRLTGPGMKVILMDKETVSIPPHMLANPLLRGPSAISTQFSDEHYLVCARAE